MLYLFAATHCEARPLIQHYHLKKDISQTQFQVFFHETANICLTITGTGMIAPAAAVACICTRHRPSAHSFLANIGICASNTEKNTVFLCNKITEEPTGRTFYPDMLLSHSFCEAKIITVSKPLSGQILEQNTSDRKEICLYDMEASSIYQAGSYFFGPHQMSFLKIISDNGNVQNVTPKLAENRIEKKLPEITEYLDMLQTIDRFEKQKADPKESEPEPLLEKLYADLHCSHAMRLSLRQQLRYCALAKIDYPSVIQNMYLEQFLPCKDKKEGKRCFEELKRRLL